MYTRTVGHVIINRCRQRIWLLGNEAYMDALAPTVGLNTDSAFGARSAALFSFMNQFNASFGLIDEELALLRGRDETLGGVAAAPTYNRLTWNFTNGDGEVARVVHAFSHYNLMSKCWNCRKLDALWSVADCLKLRLPVF